MIGGMPAGQGASPEPIVPVDPGIVQLVRETLERPDEGGLRVAAAERFTGTGAWRIRIEVDEAERTFIAKRLSARDSSISAAVANRWLPLTGLGPYSAPLLGVTGADENGYVWHLYEDLGDRTLDGNSRTGAAVPKSNAKRGFLSPQPLEPVAERVRAAMLGLSEVHAGFFGHPVLEECRGLCPDRGVDFLESSVLSAVRSLEALGGSSIELSPEQDAIRRRLLAPLGQLMNEIPTRAAEIAQLGGADTLLHGDFHDRNVIVYQERGAWRVRLIDWAHAGVGPVSYDLSQFLLHYRQEDRQKILAWYTDSASPTVRWPTNSGWNAIFDTAERSRIASSAAWLAATAVQDPSEWVFQELETVESWFRLLPPVLPTFAVPT